MHHSAEWQQYGPFHLTRDWKGDLENNSDPTEVSKEFPTRSYTANVLISGLSSHGKEKTNPNFNAPEGNLTHQKKVRYLADYIIGFKKLFKKTIIYIFTFQVTA